MTLKNRLTTFGIGRGRGPLVGALALTALTALIGSTGLACKKPAPPPPPPVTQAPAPAPVAVASVQMGTAIGADNRISAGTNTFKPTDTIYLSVTTQGEQGGKALAARFTFENGQVVHESSQALPAGANVVTEFHIAKPDGFPPGNYAVAVTLDSQPVASQAFAVR